MSGPFKLRSQGSSFKMMGSSPVKQEQYKSRPGTRYAQMSDTEKLEYDKSKVVEEERGLARAQEQYERMRMDSPKSIKEGEEGKFLAERRELTPKVKEEAEKRELTPEMGHTIVSRTGRSPGPGYEKIKGTNQWEYTGYGVS